MKLKKVDVLVVIITLIVCHMVCLWCIDVSVSAMLSSPDAIMTNGWREMNPMFAYHLGLYGAVFTLVALAVVAVHGAVKEEI